MRGFTLIELLIVIAIVVILMTATLVALNPFRQFGQANNANRMSGINAILNAVSQRIADNRGCFGSTGGTATDCPCAGDNVPTTATLMGSVAGQYNPCSILVSPTDPTRSYIAAMPIDPQPQFGSYTSCTTYNTGYNIACAGGRITICAPNAQLGQILCVTR